jgi:class 3 adenylate cyclase
MFVHCKREEILPEIITKNLRPCISNHTKHETRRRLVYADNTDHPVLVPFLGWASGQISAAVAYYLLTEAMGYESDLVNIPSLFDDKAVNFVAGCLDSADTSCQNRATGQPRIHFTLESWMMGITRASILPNDVKPTILGVLDFSVDDSYFIKRSIFREARKSEPPMFLDDYRFFDARKFKPHIFFDNWERMFDLLPHDVIVRCSDNPAFSQDFRASHYTKITGDSHVSCSYNDSVWFSPACRSNTSQCVPTIIQYAMENAMQLAFFHNFPLAIMMISAGEQNYKEYYDAVIRGRFLFSHRAPMNVLIDEAGNFPMLLNLPRTNIQQHIAGVFKTGVANIKPHNYCWRELPGIDQHVTFFASKINFYDQDMESMMLQSMNLQNQGLDTLDAAALTACQWIQSHEDRWRAWIPAKCNASTYADRTMVACLPCPRGSFCAGGFGQPVPCPENHFCPSASQSPQHCLHGMGTVEEGAVSEQDCNVCPQGHVMLSLECVSLAVPISICFGIICVIGIAGYCYHSSLENARWIIKSNEVSISEPEEVLGRGSNGLVVKGMYRGTEVAIKRFGVQMVSSDPPSSTSFKLQIWNTGIIQQPGGPGPDKAEFTNESTSKSNSSFSSTAIHNMRASVLSNPRSLQRDLKILTSIRHPCISTVLGTVRLDIGSRSELCLVMELMELGSLSDLLNNRMYPLYGDRVLQFLENIAQGMLFLHSASPPILHRDLASQNVLVDRHFNAKISDIQLDSERFGRSSSRSGNPASPSTATTLSCRKEVTVARHSIWRAPEREYGLLSDVFCFGLIVYECLTRTILSETSLETAVGLQDPPGSSQEVATLIRDCLRSDLTRRPPFQELHRRLRALSIDQMTSAAFSDEASRCSSTGSSYEHNGATGILHRKNSVSAIHNQAHRNSDSIVHSLFPPHIVEALILGKKIPPEPKGMVTMFFSDIVGFTTLSSALPAEQVSSLLNRWFDTLDSLTDKFNVYKLETIGDAFLCATNIGTEQPDHAARMARFSLAVVEAAQHTPVSTLDPSLGCLQIRVGINSGPCMATVIGRRNPKYTLFGDTINVASRMESASFPGCVQCSQATADLIRAQDPAVCLVERGVISVKGKGTMSTFWIQETGKACLLCSMKTAVSAAAVDVGCCLNDSETTAEPDLENLNFCI